jgi:type III secretion protein C
MNAVLIRDLPERMYQYEKLIPQLDTKPGIIEIEAQIVEISGDALEELGVEWRASKPGTYDLQFGGGKLPQLREGTSTGTSAPFPNAADSQLTPAGALVTLISGDAARFLTARINALTQNGSAKYLARPKVVTLDNVEALLDSSSNYYVRVAGNLEVGLFNVTVGTSLRVTPLIVNEGDTRRIKMAVRIEDGATLPNQGVDQIPATRKSTIGTQTFVTEGQSLLIAGYSEETDSQNTSGVPGLSKLPGLGALFRSNTDTHKRTERLFMITPRIVAQ